MRRGGFTMIDVVIVVLIIGILAVAAAPKVFGLYHDASASSIASHLRVLADSTDYYYAVNGEWPGNAFPNQFPPDFDGYLRETSFYGRPLGDGWWDWNGPGTAVDKIGPNMLIHGPLSDQQQAVYQRVDEILDDGNLETGDVQLIVYSNWRILQFILADD